MVCAARGEDKNATIVSVDEGKEEGWLGQWLQPKSRSSFAARYCHEERGDGRGAAWKHWAGCRAHIGLAMAKLVALKILEKDQGKS